MARLGLPEIPKRVAVAVSGGADSLCLALLAAQWAKTQGCAVYGFTVDHGLRLEAADEARQVQAWLAMHRIGCDILTLPHSLSRANLQEQAREARYLALAKACAGVDCAHLLVAHHADDQLETVLMRLIRAGGVEGLAGMRPLSRNYGLSILRPLLSIPKERLMATLQEMGQPWIEDPSNRCATYMRNRLRPLASALRAEGLSPERLALFTSQMANTAEYMKQEVNHWLAAQVERQADGVISMPLSAWQEVAPEIGWRALRNIIQDVSGSPSLMRSEKIMPIFHALAAGQLTKRRTLGGCFLVPEAKNSRLVVCREP